MVFFRVSDAEMPSSPPASFSSSSQSRTVPPVPPATPLNPSSANNLSLLRLNQANPANLTLIDNLNRLAHRPADDVSGNHPFVFTCTQPVPRPQPFSVPTDHVLGRNQSVLSTHTQTFSNPQQFPSASVDLEHHLSRVILSQQTDDGQITGKSDQPVTTIADSEDENTNAIASLVMEKPPVGKSILTGKRNVRKSLVVEKPTAETALMSEKTVETSLLSKKPARGTNLLMSKEPGETHSPPATKGLIGSGSAKSSNKQRENPPKLKLVLRSHKTVDGVQASKADVSDAAEDAKKSAVGNEKIEIERPERKTSNQRSRGAVPKTKNRTNRPESSVQTRFQTGKQVKPAAPSKFSISLTKEEIEADFLAMTGSMPPKKPKKRAKNLQRQLDRKFPGLWLGNVSTEAYDPADNPLKG